MSWENSIQRQGTNLCITRYAGRQSVVFGRAATYLSILHLMMYSNIKNYHIFYIQFIPSFFHDLRGWNESSHAVVTALLPILPSCWWFLLHWHFYSVSDPTKRVCFHFTGVLPSISRLPLRKYMCSFIQMCRKRPHSNAKKRSSTQDKGSRSSGGHLSKW